MNQKTSRFLASFLVLQMVAFNCTPAIAAQTRPLKTSDFSIAINESLPGDDQHQPISPPEPAQTPVTQLKDEHSEVDSAIDVAGESDEAPAGKERGGLFAAWSLPISGPLVFSRLIKRAPAQDKKELSGSINYEDPYETASHQIEQLLEVALSRDPNSKVLDKAVDHYRKKTQIVIAEGKDAANHVIPFRGFGPSAEAGDIITGEKLKIKSRASAEYARQKHVDELHVKVVSSMMQISMGLGMTDKARGETVTASGVSALKELVGEEEAEKAKALIANMAAQISPDDEIFKKPAWDVQERQKMHRQIMELSLDDDPVVHQIKKHIHKYNHRSKFAMVSSSVVQTMLGAASMTPTFVGPAAKTALVAFVMATGGPEQCKLLKELYLDKRLESRWKVLNEEAHMAVDNYQLAVLTKNPALLCYSESIIGQMVGGHHVHEVFGTSLLAKKAETSPTM